MSLAHLTLPSQHVQRTADFLAGIFGYVQGMVPGNSPVEARWLDIGHGQQIHVFYVAGFEVSPFEGEFGRHVAVFYPRSEFEALKTRLAAEGADVYPALRETPFERFFFREPINHYVFEVIDAARASADQAPRPSHFDQ